MKVGLFFGSFNPIHIGHLIIGNHIQQHGDLNQVWYVVTPHNPHKKKSTLANDYERLYMVNLALEDYNNLKSSDVEFSLPKPSYTIDTLTVLKEKYPENEFSLIMGMDNLQSLHKWKNHEQILKHFHIIVYNRKGSDSGKFSQHPKVQILDAPIIEISSTQVRNQIKEGKLVQPLLPTKVWEYLDGSSLYS